MQSKIKAEYPYDDYYIYIVNNKNEGRRYAVLYPIDSKKCKRTTISYARYLMSIKEGRILDSNEEVDHIDEDRINDSIDNLQILNGTENKKKYAKMNCKKTMVELRCPNCGTVFVRSKHQTYLSKGGTFSCCSKKCVYEFLSKCRRNEFPSEEIQKRLDEMYIREFKV